MNPCGIDAKCVGEKPALDELPIRKSGNTIFRIREVSMISPV